MSWDTQPRIKFELPFDNARTEKTVLFFDSILPRITVLAESALRKAGLGESLTLIGSSDRQTKVAACELLHSVLLFMIGTNATVKTPVPFVKIYARLFPVVLRLATDVDSISRQLFEPLVMQLIHWFTKNVSFESPETMALLDAIIAGVSDPTNSTLRDVSAKYVAEFLRWSVKQTSAKSQTKNPFNAKSLFKRLYSLAKHPNPYKRLGCALSFKRLYRVLREEKSLIDQFVFEIIEHLFLLLRLAETDTQPLGTTTVVERVCEALSKAIVYYRDVLNAQSKYRRQHRDLSSFAQWAFEQLRRPEATVRSTAFTLFLGTSELLSNSSYN